MKYSVACPSATKSCGVKSALSPSSAGRELSRSLVFPRFVGTGKLPGRVGGDHSLNSQEKSVTIFWAARGDHCDGGVASVMSDGGSGETIWRRIHDLLQFLDVTDSIATLTMDLSVFGSLSLRDRSFCAGEPVKIQVVILSTSRAHHMKPYVSPYSTSGGDPSSRPVLGFLAAANIRRKYDYKCSLTESWLNS